MNKEDHHFVDVHAHAVWAKTGYKRSYGHYKDDDQLWREICGWRGEIVPVRVLEYIGCRVLWDPKVMSVEEARKRRGHPDIVYSGDFGRLPLQVKSNAYPPEKIQLWIRKDQLHTHQIYILVSVARFPFCEIMGFAWGIHVRDCGDVRQDNGTKAYVLNTDHEKFRDFSELIEHPNLLVEERQNYIKRPLSSIGQDTGLSHQKEGVSTPQGHQ